MKLFRLVLVALLISSVSAPVLASYDKDKAKEGSAHSVQHASEGSIFDKVGDWFATIGKSDSEKQLILAERKAARMAKKAQKEAMKAKKEMEKKAGDMKKDLGL